MSGTIHQLRNYMKNSRTNCDPHDKQKLKN